jgi:pimeloyl-ACP methyl ester carboxylesterase/N-acetylneuraminic acid mutarotase
MNAAPALRAVLRAPTLSVVLSLALALVAMGGCSSPSKLSGLLIRPRPVRPVVPADVGLAYEDVWLPAADGAMLHGWFIPAADSNGRTVIMCHGNYSGISRYVPYYEALVSEDFNVMLFSYRGFEHSTGAPDAAHFAGDIRVVLEHVMARPDVDPDNVALFGISLGTMVALRGAADETRIAAVVVENCVSPNATVDRYVRREIPVPIVNDVISAGIRATGIPDGVEPRESIPDIDCPILFIVGSEDRIAPPGPAVKACACAHDGRLWVMANAGHVPDPLIVCPEEYIHTITTFLDRAMTGSDRTIDLEYTTCRRHGWWCADVDIRLRGERGPDDRAPIEFAAWDGKDGFVFERRYVEASAATLELRAPFRIRGVSAKRWRHVVDQGDGTWTPAPPAAGVFDQAALHVITEYMARRSDGLLELDEADRVIMTIRQAEATWGSFSPALEAELVDVYLGVGEALLAAAEASLHAEGRMWLQRCVDAAPEDPAAHRWIGISGASKGFRGAATVERAEELLARSGIAMTSADEPGDAGRRHFTAAAVLESQVVVCGGYRPGRGFVADTARLDVETWRWERLPDLPTPRAAHAASVCGERLFVFGGVRDDGGAMADANVLDARSRTWMRVPALPTPRNRLAAAAIGSRIFVVGGMTINDAGRESNTAAVEVLDTHTMTWTTAAPMPTPRHGHAVVRVGTDLWVIGGYGDGGPTGVVEIYDPASDTWRAGPSLEAERGFHGAAVVDGAVYVFGGRAGTALPTEILGAERLDPTPRQIAEPGPGPMLEGVGRFAAVVIDGAIIAIGGETVGGGVPASPLVQVLDVGASSWRSVAAR